MHATRALTLIAYTLVPMTISAQNVARADSNKSAMQRAEALVASGDTAQAIATLKAAVSLDAKNGPLWHAYGMLLSDANRGARRSGDMALPLPMIQMATAADSALNLAMVLSPDSARFIVDYVDYLWGLRWWAGNRTIKLAQRAISMLEKSSDTILTSRVADQLALMMWREFELNIGKTASAADIDQDGAFGGRPFKPTDHPISQLGQRNLVPMLSDPCCTPPVFLTSAGLLKYMKENYPQPKFTVGLAQFPSVVRYARMAREINPDVPLYFRHEAMMLAGMKQWAELGDAARKQIAKRPRQAWPWLSLGLSELRSNHTGSAMAAFDSGFARLPESDRERLSSISRLLQTPQGRMYDTLSALGKSQLRTLYFNSSNPSFLLPSNPMLAEFRARVVHAELLFTEDETNRPGTETERGDAFIRYGPPDYTVYRRPSGDPNLKPLAEVPANIWFYIPIHLSMVFWQSANTGSAYISRSSRDIVEQAHELLPSAWTNVPVVQKGVDRISTQVARFRAPADSIDVVAFASINVGILRRNAPGESSAIQHGLFIVDALGTEIVHAKGVMNSSERDMNAVAAQGYRVRAPATARGARVDALEPDMQQGAYSVSEFGPFASRGFGVSDLLLAADVADGKSNGVERWNNYAITPLAGTRASRNKPLSLVWESYEPKSTNGTARMRFSVSVYREAEGGLTAMAARVIGGLRNAILRPDGGTENRLTITFEREAAALPVFVDYLKVDLASLQPGQYRVGITVTDLVGGETRSSHQNFEVLK